MALISRCYAPIALVLQYTRYRCCDSLQCAALLSCRSQAAYSMFTRGSLTVIAATSTQWGQVRWAAVHGPITSRILAIARTRNARASRTVRAKRPHRLHVVYVACIPPSHTLCSYCNQDTFYKTKGTATASLTRQRPDDMGEEGEKGRPTSQVLGQVPDPACRLSSGYVSDVNAVDERSFIQTQGASHLEATASFKHHLRLPAVKGVCLPCVNRSANESRRCQLEG